MRQKRKHVPKKKVRADHQKNPPQSIEHQEDPRPFQYQIDYDYSTWKLPKGTTIEDYYTADCTMSIVKENCVTTTMQMFIDCVEDLKEIPKLHDACFWNEINKQYLALVKEGKDYYIKACIRDPFYTYSVKSLLWPPNFFKGYGLCMMGYPKLQPEYLLDLMFVRIGEDDQPLPTEDSAPFTDSDEFVDEKDSRIPPTLWHSIPLCSPVKGGSLYTHYLDCRIIETDPLLSPSRMLGRTVKEIAKRYLFEAYLYLQAGDLQHVLLDVELDDGRYKGDTVWNCKGFGWRSEKVLPHRIAYDEIERALMKVTMGDRFIMKVTYAVLPEYMDHKIMTSDTPSTKNLNFASTSTYLHYCNYLTPKKEACVNIQDLFHIDHLQTIRDTNHLEHYMRIREVRHYVLYNMARAEAFGLLLLDIMIELVQKYVYFDGTISLSISIQRPCDKDAIVIPSADLIEYSGGGFLWKTNFGDGKKFTGDVDVRMVFGTTEYNSYNIPSGLSYTIQHFSTQIDQPGNHRCIMDFCLKTEYETYLRNIRWHPLPEEIEVSGSGLGFDYKETNRHDQRRFFCAREFNVTVKSRDSYAEVMIELIDMLLPFMKKHIGSKCLDVGVFAQDSIESSTFKMLPAELIYSHLLMRKVGFNPKNFILRVVFFGPHANRFGGLVDEFYADKEPKCEDPVDYDKVHELMTTFKELEMGEEWKVPTKLFE